MLTADYQYAHKYRRFTVVLPKSRLHMATACYSLRLLDYLTSFDSIFGDDLVDYNCYSSAIVSYGLSQE